MNSLCPLPIALIAYLLSPRYRGYLLTNCNGFLDEGNPKIREAWDSILQYIGIRVDEKMKKVMYNIMVTYCVDSFSIDNLHPAFRQSVNSIDCSYWDKVKKWCTTSGRNEVRIYFVIACVAIRCLLAPGTSSRLESAFSIMKLLSTSSC